MACFERQGRVSSGAGAQRRGPRTGHLPSATRHRVEDCLISGLAGGTCSWVGWLGQKPKIAFDSLDRKQDSGLRHSSRPCRLCDDNK